MGKMASFLVDNRTGEPRQHLLGHWNRHTNKFISRHTVLASKGCNFSDTYEDNSVDFDSTNTCRVLNQVGAAFSAWGRQFTSDCNKENRGTQLKWFDRNNAKFQSLSDRTRSRLNCN